MRVAITGATGNVGTSLLGAMADDPQIDSIVGIARRRPTISFPKTEWATADVSRDDLAPLFQSCDAVVHLAWLIQPSRDPDALRATNVEGTRAVLRAVASAEVPNLVYASSVGAYSPGPKDRPVDENWPTEGVAGSVYSMHKAETEWMLDDFENEVPQVRVVRMRPGLIFKRESASSQRRLFAGPLLPNFLIRRAAVPVLPVTDRLVFQCLHSLDAAEAYRLAIVSDVRGAFNIAADPILGPDDLADIFRARAIHVSERAIRQAAALTWRARLQPTDEGWADLAFESPVMATSRASSELGWTPKYSSREALIELLEGMRDRAGMDTPPLAPSAGGPARVKEFLTGIGGRE
ncbi:MAG TPA: NAD-dependent epimerase/dehydratase family protein [Actinomycetota bacterium]|nr:NAD-dependent epimerase/dehydratase family protein [Actinomycetota bacterium]